MRSAAITRIHRSEALLGLWLHYYSRYFDDLFVFAGQHEGASPGTFENLLKEYSFTLIPVEDNFYSMGTHHMVFSKQKELLMDHGWVLYTDADEIVVADPKKYDGLRHFMDVCTIDQTYCVGYEVIKVGEEGPIDYTKPILAQRSTWVRDKTKSYNKPALSRIPTDWVEGFHYIAGRQSEMEEAWDTGLFMLHTKHMDPDTKFDFPRNSTGNHDIDTGGSEPIPESIRRIF